MRRGAATAILLEPDDRLTVRDLDGGQRAEVTALGVGTDGLDGLGTSADGDATVLRSLVGSAEDGAAEIVDAVAARGIDPTRARAAVLFGPSTPPGAETTLRAERPLLVVVGASGATETVIEGGTPGVRPRARDRARATAPKSSSRGSRSRLPTPGSTSRSTAPPRSHTR